MASHTNFPKLKLSMLAVACMGMMSVAHAGQIIGVQQGSPSPVLSGTEEWKNGFGGWNLGNVSVKIVDAETKQELPGSYFNESTGSYARDSEGHNMIAGDSFISEITDGAGTIMAKLSGKDWPVGEPDGVKVITTDTISDLSNGRPASCIMTTSYLSYDDLSDTEKEAGYTGYLDTAMPAPTVCGSPFQTHKRFKVSALPSTVDGTGTDAVDLVFNLDTGSTSTAETSVRRYSVLQKLNNYTNKRLKGFKILLGTGVGANFTQISSANTTLTNELSLSIGAGDGSDFWASDDLATFSAGLFGPVDSQHDRDAGFFSSSRAYFPVTLTDKTEIDGSASALSNNYTDLFGDWIPSTYMPKGIFYDDDANPATDAKLVAYWDGSEWKYGQANSFAAVPSSVLADWAENSLYSIGDIEDLVNLGLNYMVQVGNVNTIKAQLGQSNFTIRLVPVVSSDTSGTHTNAATAPSTLSGYLSTGGSASAYDQFSLLASILAFLGFGGWMVRRKLTAQSK